MGKRSLANGAGHAADEMVPVKRIKKRLAEGRVAKQRSEKHDDTDVVRGDEDTTIGSNLVAAGATHQPGEAQQFSANFMPLDITTDKAALRRAKKKGSRSKAAVVEAKVTPKSNVIYVGRIPHGFYEDQMRGFFGQFGTITRLRISRNKKTGSSKHYAFVEFESPEVAVIVADSMHNYLLFESMLQVRQVPLERIHPQMWVGANKKFRPTPSKKIQRTHQNRARTIEEQNRLMRNLVKKDRERRKKLEAAGIYYDFPSLASLVPQSSKKIKFDQD
eukprot:TRINITY_DN184_c0_g2_i1.p1 TRINITY_DN184_c0_g2~~TRINITY_DN184_c0_g2_i1.p1  ORF type:complete len:275 (-),score=52.74 TRINITY_DN184_c0_g2_i1:562-1386(-)